MTEIIYKIEFLSDWHCGSGLSAGADVDALCIKDEHGLPFVPGKTIKGLLREAAEIMFDDEKDKMFIKECFGEATKRENSNIEDTKQGKCYFSNAELSQELKKNIDNDEKQSVLYRKISSTSIDKNGIAEEHSLRKMEVAVPLTVYGKISDIPKKEDFKEKLIKCMKYTKRLGTNRNRGLGRCVFELFKEAQDV